MTRRGWADERADTLPLCGVGYRMFLEARPFYPLYLHQANSMRSSLWSELVEKGGDHWYLNNRSRSHLIERFRLTCEVDLPEWLSKLRLELPEGDRMTET